MASQEEKRGHPGSLHWPQYDFANRISRLCSTIVNPIIRGLMELKRPFCIPEKALRSCSVLCTHLYHDLILAYELDQFSGVGHNGKVRDELLDRELFYNPREAQVLIEDWRTHYNTQRSHSTLGYRPRRLRWSRHPPIWLQD